MPNLFNNEKFIIVPFDFNTFRGQKLDDYWDYSYRLLASSDDLVLKNLRVYQSLSSLEKVDKINLFYPCKPIDNLTKIETENKKIYQNILKILKYMNESIANRAIKVVDRRSLT